MVLCLINAVSFWPRQLLFLKGLSAYCCLMAWLGLSVGSVTCTHLCLLCPCAWGLAASTGGVLPVLGSPLHPDLFCIWEEPVLGAACCYWIFSILLLDEYHNEQTFLVSLPNSFILVFLPQWQEQQTQLCGMAVVSWHQYVFQPLTSTLQPIGCWSFFSAFPWDCDLP